MADLRGRLDPITVVIPRDELMALRSAARSIRDGIAEDYERFRHESREKVDMARRRAAELADLDVLLGQLGDNEDRDREVTGDYDTVHGVACNALMGTIEDLAVAGGMYWRHEGRLGDVERRIDNARRYVTLLRAVEQAADEVRGDDDDRP